ncbi:choice-of-anchor R domain-containing protein [Chamaesiphon sp. VAR_48_metabat_403]|uniref:choice-of-anchor R domain-containing protein n=1 Tax=Chamaesiphon sp. VAR_48_metabat_403 TaxID=2964700 RepID=UPI00286DC7D8|nr:choice-of-anchor R domain-containing protein [Chamaesiphon sp. VAR_48_metabat_403]
MLAGTLAFSSSATAATLIGNLPQNRDFYSFNIQPSESEALSFTLPTGSNYNLDNIILRLESYQSSADTPKLQIYADSAKTSTSPNGTTLQSVTFANPTSTSAAVGNFTFTPNSAFTFLADTRYWLRLSNSTDFLSWKGSEPVITPTGIPGITFNSSKISLNNGASYLDVNPIPTFQINATAAGAATAVPEPTSLPGYITLLGGLLAARKIVKSRAAKKVEFK